VLGFKDIDTDDSGSEKQFKLKKKDVDLLILTAKSSKEKETWISQFKSAKAADHTLDHNVRLEEKQTQQNVRNTRKHQKKKMTLKINTTH